MLMGYKKFSALFLDESVHFGSTDVINGVLQLSPGLFILGFVTQNIPDATDQILTKHCRMMHVNAPAQMLQNHWLTVLHIKNCCTFKMKVS